MRIATVLAVASLGGVFGQDEPVPSDLSSAENETLSLAQRLLIVPSDYASTCWNSPQCCDITSTSASLILGSTCKLPIPFPTDNYVSDKRINRFDDASVKTAKAHPYVEITSTPGISTGGVAWSHYVQHPLDVQSKITFSTPGLYTLGISAWDYEGDASCDGCVAILDKFRPRFKGGCPSGLTTATLGTTAKAVEYEAYFDISVAPDKRENNPGSGENCNEELYKVKYFYEDEQPLAGKCFSTETLNYNLIKLKTDPFSDPLNLQKFAVDLDPVLNGKCVWSCTKSITLKELFVEYACPSTTPNPVCSGRNNGSNKCSMNVLISSTGRDIATASLEIRENVQKASKKSLVELKNDAGDVKSTVHYITQCTALDKTSDCTYKTKVSDLIKVSSTKASKFPGSGESDDYVFWRYNLGGGTWKTLKSDDVEAFTEAFTTVNLQAWTACGVIGEFHFDVKLYTHSLLTCDNFNSLWSAPDMETRGGAYCSVPGSDFTIFNLNYDYSTFIAPNTDSTPLANGQYEGVTCKIMVAENDDSLPAYDQVPFTETSDDEFLKEDDKHPTFTKEFAVELVHDPHTAHKTYFTVECTVTRSSYNGNNSNKRNNDHNGPGQLLALDAYGPEDINTVTCPATFYLTDCEIPKLGDPSGICTDKCAGKPAPSVNEVCGGTVVTTVSKTKPLGTVIETVVSSDKKQCCKDCNLQCNPVSTSPTRTSSIKRCDYVTPTTAPPNSLTVLAAAEQKIFSSETATALLGASAMVAVVALIVVKRRADAAASAQEAEDAYYPLLE